MPLPHLYLPYLICRDAFSFVTLKYTLHSFPHFSWATIAVHILTLTPWMVITVLILAFLLLPVLPVPWQVEFPLLLYHSPAHECFMAPYCLLSILISLLSLQYSPYPNSIIFIRFSPMITHLSGVYRLASTIPCVSKTHPPLCCRFLYR